MAVTINATDCSQAAVQAALNSVSADDTVVKIPAGNCSWNTTVTYDRPFSVSIFGAGSTTTVGGGDSTVIVDNFAGGSGPPLLDLTVAVGKTLRLSAISFFAGTRNIVDNGSLKFHCNNSVGELRLDHFHLKNLGTGVGFNNCFGVVDHSIFDQPAGSVYNSTHIWHTSYGGGSDGNGAWAQNADLGSGKLLYFEDNVFNYGIANDCTVGGRNAFRKNTFNATGVQTHPTGGGGPDGRGCRVTELYENTFIGPTSGTPAFNVFFMSAGTGMLWGNSAPSGYQHFVTLHSMRKDNSTYPEANAPAGWGYCGSAFNGVASPWDGNTNSSGYPCLDQPGRGKGDLLSGLAPNKVNTTTGTIAWPHQALEPVYEWSNTFNAAPGYNGKLFNNYNPDVLVANQDFFLGSDGSGGVKSGTLASRPTTCSNLYAYWATDTRTLYQCGTSNNWSVYYKPYTYPHPIVAGTPPPVTPSKPKNFKILRAIKQ